MKSIYNDIQRCVKYKQKQCPFFKNSICTEQRCDCRIEAEVWAYIRNVVPEDYYNKTIQDFTGMHNGNVVLSKAVLRQAREDLIRYCWAGIEPGEDYDAGWITKSIISRRLETGSSLVIYGNPWANGVAKFGRKCLGKTLIAAIVMKEAIFQRVKPERLADTYAWASGKMFGNRLMENAKHGSYEEEVQFYKEVDWLVIDGLELEPESGRQFRINMFDSYFSERTAANRPTVFVFQDDISKINNLQYEFGSEVNKIINSSKTHHIALLDK